jgi:predicted dehydrogenase
VIFCEKPIATNVADAARMVTTCNEMDVELLVNHTRRFHPDVQALREFIEDGALGEVVSVNVQWAGEPLRNGPHVVDIVLLFLDAVGAGVAGGHLRDDGQSQTQYDDTGGAGILHLDNGTVVTLDLTRTRQQPARVTDFVGTDGRLVVDWWYGDVQYWECTDSLVTPRPEARESLYGDFREQTVERFESFSTESETSFAHAATYVRDLIAGRTANCSPSQNARQVLALLTGVYISAYNNGMYVDFPLERPLQNVTISLP